MRLNVGLSHCVNMNRCVHIFELIRRFLKRSPESILTKLTTYSISKFRRGYFCLDFHVDTIDARV
ncbi:hypothetical protein WN48_07988 [Eufriesea mexicana]|uniref:Uncharacterized protein n=1 Tax=Eufriesea mexicana TaxID=516756 RepID=A0A310SP58_9HYME|nr:hypothetical protein WN48_07988 [Eufriesea mexicana]